MAKRGKNKTASWKIRYCTGAISRAANLFNETFHNVTGALFTAFVPSRVAMQELQCKRRNSKAATIQKEIYLFKANGS